MLPDILGDHRPGKVGMFAGPIAILAPGKETLLDVGRAQVLLETQAQACEVRGQGGRVESP